MDEVLDESIVKTKYESREVPGYLNDFSVIRLLFDIIFSKVTSAALRTPDILICYLNLEIEI